MITICGEVFSNMLRDIAHLDKTEIEGIILWNRLLVYATLFGYADRVSRVMAASDSLGKSIYGQLCSG